MSRSKDVEPRVEKLLIDRPYLRSNDKELMLVFWASEGFILSQEQYDRFINCTPAESITRARRALRDKYPGSDDAEKARFERFEEEQLDHVSPKKAVSWLHDD